MFIQKFIFMQLSLSYANSTALRRWRPSCRRTNGIYSAYKRNSRLLDALHKHATCMETACQCMPVYAGVCRRVPVHVYARKYVPRKSRVHLESRLAYIHNYISRYIGTWGNTNNSQKLESSPKYAININKINKTNK